MDKAPVSGNVLRRANSSRPSPAAKSVWRKSSRCERSMPEEKQISGEGFSQDILEFLRLLERHEIRYVIVGGEAVIFYGYPRFTGDIDFFFGRDTENIERLFRCLLEFWNGNIPAVKEADELREEGLVLQFGRPPHRLDLLNKIDGIEFEEAWSGRQKVLISAMGAQIRAYYLGKSELIKNKAASSRPKDLDDIEHLS
jgi:hypothetical protein